MLKYIYRLSSTIFLVILFSFIIIKPVSAAALLDKYHGASLVSRNSTDPSSEQWRQTLRDLKANNVNLVTYVLLYRQTTINSSDIYESSNNPTEASLIEGIQYAHSLGLEVQLKPHIDNDDRPTFWRGQINPTDREAWFANYGRILNHIADIARNNGVEEICIGTELYSMTIPQIDPANTNHWKSLITQIRSHYSGVLTYSSIFAGEIEQIEFWDKLDYIGVSGYWHLSTSKDPSVEQLLASWNGINTNLLQPLSQRTNKQIVLTEVGYRSIDCSTVYSWGGVYCGTDVNMNEQVNAYEALLSFFENTPNLKGVVIWGWEPDPNSGGLNDNTFSPQNKPALEVIKKWYGGDGTYVPLTSTTSQVFDDNYQSDWTNWSWDMTSNIVDSPNPTGSKVLKMVTNKPWAGLRLNSFIGQQSSGFNSLNFSILSSDPNQKYGIWLGDINGSFSAAIPISNYSSTGSNGWKDYSIPLKDLSTNDKIIRDIYIQDWSGQIGSATYFDNIQFQAIATPTPTPTPSPSFVPRSDTSISANPNPCYVPQGTGTCTSTITWAVGNPQGIVQVRVREGYGLFAQAPSGSQDVPWITYPTYFDLYDGDTLVNSVLVTATVKLGTIQASPNPCQIPEGSDVCTEAISWSVANPQGVVQVRVRETNGLFGQAPSYTQNAPWVNQTPLHMDLYDGNNLLDTVVIQGQPASTPPPTPSPNTTSLIFADSLASGWISWSWDTIVDLASPLFYQGSKAITFKTNAVWGGLRLHNDAGIDINSYNYLEFAAQSNSSDKSYGLSIIDKDGKQIGQGLPLSNYGGAPNDTYKVYSIPLSDFGSKGIIKDIIIQDWSGETNNLLNIDEIKFAP